MLYDYMIYDMTLLYDISQILSLSSTLSVKSKLANLIELCQPCQPVVQLMPEIRVQRQGILKERSAMMQK